MSSAGIHHVTAIAGEPRRNLDFYRRTLGLRFVKKTVNFDDPGTYHFYFGDGAGHPGTILTFFPWAHSAPGRIGIGETQETVFRVPEAALGYWMQRLIAHGVKHEAPKKRFGETVLAFHDPDGMRLALAAVPGIGDEPAWKGDVPEDVAIHGFHGVNLLVADAAPTAEILTDVLGFREAGREGSLIRYKAEGNGPGKIVDLHAAGDFLRGRLGKGSVHHVAFRSSDDAAQAAMAKQLRERGIAPTEQMDRNYFRSIYFREPGGVLFEIATDAPGFAVDEPADALGEGLKLPPFLETRRAALEAVLPALD
jgi:glyoxalase family protein